MNLRKNFVSVVGAAALMLGMTGGIALAQVTDDDSADTKLNVTCPQTVGIDVEVIGQFEVDASSGADYYNASLPGGFTMELDLTCNWSTNFSVDATIGTFNHTGTTQPGQASSIPGGVLQLTNGVVVDRVGPDWIEFTGGLFPVAITTGDPVVESIVFNGLTDEDFDIIANDTLLNPFIEWASPGVSTMVWDGELVVLPPNLAEGLYVAPLTVTLAVN